MKLISLQDKDNRIFMSKTSKRSLMLVSGTHQLSTCSGNLCPRITSVHRYLVDECCMVDCQGLFPVWVRSFLIRNVE